MRLPFSKSILILLGIALFLILIVFFFLFQVIFSQNQNQQLDKNTANETYTPQEREEIINTWRVF